MGLLEVSERQIYCATQQVRCSNLRVKETFMDRWIDAYDPKLVAAAERKGRRLRDEYIANLIRRAWRSLFRRTPAERPQPETAAHPARA